MLPHELSLYVSLTYYDRQLKPLGRPGYLLQVQRQACPSLIQRTSPLLNPLSGASPYFLSRVLTVSFQFHSCVGIIGSIFVYESWGFRATDRMMSLVAGPNDTGSIAPPDYACNFLRRTLILAGSSTRDQATHASPRRYTS